MDRRAAIALIVALGTVGLVIGLLAAGGGGSTNAFPTVGAAPGTPLPDTCLPVPEPPAEPLPAPAALPLPPGSYVTELADEAGIRRYTAAVDASLDDFVTFLQEEWPARGWVLGRGEREPGEAETVFLNEDLIGQMVARAVYCEDDRTHVTLLITDRSTGE